MPRLCSICAHPTRAGIDSDLLAHQASYRVIARHYGVHWDALQRHERAHLGQSFRQSQEAQALMNTDRLVARIEQLEGAVDHVLSHGESGGNDRLVLLAVREGRANVESLARLGALSDVEARLVALEQARAGESGKDGAERDGSYADPCDD